MARKQTFLTHPSQPSAAPPANPDGHARLRELLEAGDVPESSHDLRDVLMELGYQPPVCKPFRAAIQEKRDCEDILKQAPSATELAEKRRQLEFLAKYQPTSIDDAEKLAAKMVAVEREIGHMEYLVSQAEFAKKRLGSVLRWIPLLFGLPEEPAGRPFENCAVATMAACAGLNISPYESRNWRLVGRAVERRRRKTRPAGFQPNQ